LTEREVVLLGIAQVRVPDDLEVSACELALTKARGQRIEPARDRAGEERGVEVERRVG